MDLIILLIFNSLAVLGFWYACSYKPPIGSNGDARPEEKQILGFIRKYGTRWFGEKFMKPICTCPVCMSSIHGTWFFWTFIHTGTLEWVTWILALAGLMVIYVQKGFVKTWMV